MADTWKEWEVLTNHYYWVKETRKFAYQWNWMVWERYKTEQACKDAIRDFRGHGGKRETSMGYLDERGVTDYIYIERYKYRKRPRTNPDKFLIALKQII